MSTTFAGNRNTPIMKDWYLLGLTTGMISAAAKTAANYLAQKAGLATESFGTMAGNMVLGRRSRYPWIFRQPKITIEERAIGTLSDIVFGGIFGVFASYIYSKTPPGNEIAKGALGGAAIWALTFTLPNQIKVSHTLPKQMITLLGVDVLYGVVQGALIGRFGTQLTQQSHPMLVKPVSDRQYDRGRMSVPRGRQSLM